MIDFVLYSDCSSESAKALARGISQRQGKECRAVGRSRGGERFVRYGSMHPCEGRCLNSMESIKLASNKLGALITMEEAGVRVPRLFLYHAGPANCKRVFRKLQHCAGNDNPYILNANGDPGVASSYDYSIEWIDKFEEYRVHVFRGEVIRVQKKRRKRSGVDSRSIWSLKNGWVLIECESPFSWLTWLACKAVASLGLDFGAVDIVRSKWGGLYVIEVNTAPGIIPGGVDKYADACVRWDNESLCVFNQWY